MSSIDQQFIEYVVKSLVSMPDDVSIERTIDEKGVLLQLTVNPEDLGRVIGKRGATAQSMRTLLRALGTKNEARYNLKIVDNGVDSPARTPRDDAPKKEDAPVEDEKPSEEPGDVVEEKVEEVEEAVEEVEEAGEGRSFSKKTLDDLDDLDDLDI